MRFARHCPDPRQHRVGRLQPAPPGWSFQEWTTLCSNEIDYGYSNYSTGMDFERVVPDFYGL